MAKQQKLLNEINNISTIKELGDILETSPIFKELILQLGLDLSKSTKENFSLGFENLDLLTYMINKINKLGIKFNLELGSTINTVMNNTYVGTIESLDIILRVAILGLRGEGLEYRLEKFSNVTEVIEVLFSLLDVWSTPNQTITSRINQLIDVVNTYRTTLPFSLPNFVMSHEPQDYLVGIAVVTVITILLLKHNVVEVEYVTKH